MSLAERERLLHLEGGLNLRDFGGYRTKDGRTVAWGRLFRSGAMHRVTDIDIAQLKRLGINTICDFRRESERTRAPTLWHQDTGAEYLALNIDGQTGHVTSLLGVLGTTREQVRQAMIDNYRTIPVEHMPSYQAMFERLAAGRTPMLINCAAGKDRTGIGAALVLLTLGVSREDIYADYLLTNEHAGYDRLFPRQPVRADGSLAERSVCEPLAAADTDYLDTFFATLEGEHGGLDAYLANTLGIDAAKQDAIRAHLLV